MADAKSGQKDECDFYKAICTIRGKDHKTKGIACAVNIHGKENEEEVLLVTWKGCIGDGRNSVETVHRYWSKSKLRISKKNSEDYQLKPLDDGILNRGDFSLIRCALGDNKKGKKKWGVRLPIKYLKKEQQRGDLLAYTIRDDSYLLLNLKYDKRAERHILDIEEDLRANLILQGAPIIEGEEYFVGVLVEDEEGKVSPLFTTEGIFG